MYTHAVRSDTLGLVSMEAVPSLPLNRAVLSYPPDFPTPYFRYTISYGAFVPSAGWLRRWAAFSDQTITTSYVNGNFATTISFSGNNIVPGVYQCLLRETSESSPFVPPPFRLDTREFYRQATVVAMTSSRLRGFLDLHIEW